MVIWLWYENIKSLPIIEPRFPGCFQASRDQGLDQGPPQADVLILPSPETSSWSSQAPPAWAWTWRWWSGQWCWSATCSPTPAWTSSPPGLCSHSPLLNQGEKKMLVHQHMLYFWNPNDSLIPNMMIDTSPCSSCSSQSPWLPCSGHTVSSTGPSVSPFRDFLNVHKKDAKQIITKPYFGDPACKIWDSARPALHPWLKQLTAECLTNWNICKLKYWRMNDLMIMFEWWKWQNIATDVCVFLCALVWVYKCSCILNITWQTQFQCNHASIIKLKPCLDPQLFSTK